MDHFEIILFYNYVTIDDPAELMRRERVLCEKLGLRGRMIIAHEGINATFEGTKEYIDQYLEHSLAD